MAFCNFSGDKLSENSIIIDNAFFTEFLPIANILNLYNKEEL